MTAGVDDEEHELDLDRLHVDLAAAFVRGRLALDEPIYTEDPARAVLRGKAEGLRVHRYKRTTLPRVKRVVGALRALAPQQLLDVGSGRGTFLWALLDAFPRLEVLSIDLDPIRVRDLDAMHRGGLTRLRARRGDVQALDLEDGAVDGSTALEVLEHVQDPARAARELLRVSRRFVVASVPSQPDDNPEHLRLFSADDLTRLFTHAGARRVSLDHVLDHRIALVFK